MSRGCREFNVELDEMTKWQDVEHRQKAAVAQALMDGKRVARIEAQNLLAEMMEKGILIHCSDREGLEKALKAHEAKDGGACPPSP